MAGRHIVWASILVSVWTRNVQAETPVVGAARPHSPSSANLPLEKLPTATRAILERPTLAARGPAEVFACRPEHYYWLLDHPDKGVAAWRRLGAKCVSITDQGNGTFGWADDIGSSVTWQTVFSDGDKRIWFAQGKVRPAPLLPLVPVRAVLVLHHRERQGQKGGTFIQHYADLYVHTDSTTASLLTKALGASAPRMAEQGLAQLQMFFSALCSYLERHPQRTATILCED